MFITRQRFRAPQSISIEIRVNYDERILRTKLIQSIRNSDRVRLKKKKSDIIPYECLRSDAVHVNHRRFNAIHLNASADGAEALIRICASCTHLIVHHIYKFASVVSSLVIRGRMSISSINSLFDAVCWF